MSSYHQRLFVFTALVAFLSVVATSEQITLKGLKLPLLDRAAKKKINICFALDGSKSLSRKSFALQKTLTLQIVRRLDGAGKIGYAAVQYGTASAAISPLTTNAKVFSKKVKGSKQLKSSKTFLVSGINYCFSQLFRARGKGVIVLLGDGRGNIGASAVARANLFKKTGGEVYAVGVGRPDLKVLGSIASRRNLFSIREVSAIKSAAAKIIKSLLR